MLPGRNKTPVAISMHMMNWSSPSHVFDLCLAWDHSASFYNLSSPTDNGGAVFLEDSATLNLNDGRFNNTSAYRGGAMYVTSAASVNVAGSVIFSNATATYDGGAVYCRDRCSLNINNATFWRNAALSPSGGRGGGLYLENKGTVLNSRGVLAFFENSANRWGGAFFARDSATATVNDLLFERNNVVSYDGAGFYGTDAGVYLNVTGTASFTSNNATGNGGGIYIQLAAKVLANRLNFTSNWALNGAGAYVTGLQTIFNCSR